MIAEPLQAGGLLESRCRQGDDWRAAAGRRLYIWAAGMIAEPLQAVGLLESRCRQTALHLGGGDDRSAAAGRGIIGEPLQADGYTSRCGFVRIYWVMRS